MQRPALFVMESYSYCFFFIFHRVEARSQNISPWDLRPLLTENALQNNNDEKKKFIICYVIYDCIYFFEHLSTEFFLNVTIATYLSPTTLACAPSRCRADT